MNDNDFKRLLDKIDIIEKKTLDLIEERDMWKKMYYDLKGESEKLMEEVKHFLQYHS